MFICILICFSLFIKLKFYCLDISYKQETYKHEKLPRTFGANDTKISVKKNKKQSSFVPNNLQPPLFNSYKLLNKLPDKVKVLPKVVSF